MRKLSLVLTVLICVAFLASCGDDVSYVEDSFFAMDTVVSFRIVSATASEDLKECERMIGDLEKLLSPTVAESDVSRFNASNSGCAVSKPVFDVVAVSVELSQKTGGAYDPTIASLTQLWDITGESPRVPDESEIAEAMSHTGVSKLKLTEETLTVEKDDSGLMLDSGGAAKGYACQAICEYLLSRGGYGLVSFGSSVGVYGEKQDGEPWNIGITDPGDTSSTIGYVSIDGGYLSVSGDYERFAEIDGKRYCHIFDPSTGYPADNGVHSAVVWSQDGAAADIISTALFVMGEDGIDALKNAGLEFEALLITDDGFSMSDGMKDIMTFYSN